MKYDRRNAPTATLGGSESPLDAAPGDRFGRFTVQERIGEGAMGVVYRAHDAELARSVALKVLGGPDDSGRGRARMLREAQAIAKLDHPNVVAVYEVGALDDDRVYFAMQFVEGETLRDWLERGPHPASDIIARFTQAGRGLAAAHAAELVHRDFKPANVLVDRHGHVRVADFGLARLAEGGADDVGGTGRAAGRGAGESLTRTGALIGTPRYMAPEQIDRRTADARSDQFAFCAALWEALADRHPFEGDGEGEGIEGMRQQMHRGPGGTPRGVSARVTAALRRGLSLRASDRFPSMEALLDSIRPPRRRGWVIAATAVAAACATAAIGTTFVQPISAVLNAPPVCAAGDTEAEKAWGPAQAARVRDAFATIDVPAARSQSERFIEILDARTDEWSEKWREVCRATHVANTQSDEAMDLRMACLDRRRSELSSLVDILEESPLRPKDLQDLTRAALELRPLSWCDDVGALRDQTQLPQDPTRKAEAEALLAEIERAKMRSTTRYDTKVETLVDIVRRARELDFPPALAELLYEEGLLRERAGDIDTAIARHKEAVAVAARARDAMLEGYAWVGLAKALTLRDRENGLAEAKVALEAAKACAARAIDPDWLLGHTYALEGRLAGYLERDLERAAELLAKAQALFEKTQGPNSLDAASQMRELAAVEAKLGRHDEAEALALRSIEIARSLLGEKHALVASGHYRMVMAATRREDFDSAVKHARIAYDIRKATGGASDYYTLLMANAVAQSLLGAEQLDEALEWATRAVDGYAASDNHRVTVMLIDPLTTRAEIYAKLGRSAEALADLERGLDAAVEELGPKHVLVEEARKLQAKLKAG